VNFILHIGISKTGTTSLQSWLGTARPHLRTQGVHYLRSVGRENHTTLPRLCFSSIPPHDEYFKKRGLTTQNRIQRHLQSARLRLLQELEELPGGIHTIVSSSEHLYSRLNTIGDIQNCRNLLSPFCSRFRIVVYLRNQADFIESLYTTYLLKTSGSSTLHQFAEEYRTKQSGLLDYAARLRNWEDVFGRDNMLVRIYSKNDLQGGNTKTDFISCCLPGIDGAFHPPAIYSNRSVHRTGQVILRSLNMHLAPGTFRGQRFRLHTRIKEIIAQMFTGPGLKLSQLERQTIAEHFAISNARVSRLYFPERRTLF
jgi:hypothetical protein